MANYSIKKGRHDFRPIDSIGLIWPFRKRRKYKVTFAANCNYHLEDGDQFDWNKGGGFSFSMLSNRKNAVMWAWRYLPHIFRMQLCAYWHVDGKAHYAETEGDSPFALEPGQPVTIELYKENGVWIVSFKSEGGYLRKETTAKGCPIRPIGLWFGGNKPAPKQMDILLSKS